MPIRANERVAWFNGAFMPESEAKVSGLDSGFNMVGLDIVEQALGHLEPAEHNRLLTEWRTTSAS